MKAAGRVQLVDGNRHCLALRRPPALLQRKAVGTVPDEPGRAGTFLSGVFGGAACVAVRPVRGPEAPYAELGDLDRVPRFADTSACHLGMPIACSNARRTSGGWP